MEHEHRRNMGIAVGVLSVFLFIGINCLGDDDDERRPPPMEMLPEGDDQDRLVEGYALRLEGGRGFRHPLLVEVRRRSDDVTVEYGEDGTQGTVTFTMDVVYEEYASPDQPLQGYQVPQSAEMTLSVVSYGAPSTWDGTHRYSASAPSGARMEAESGPALVEWASRNIAEALMEQVEDELGELEED